MLLRLFGARKRVQSTIWCGVLKDGVNLSPDAAAVSQEARRKPSGGSYTLLTLLLATPTTSEHCCTFSSRRVAKVHHWGNPLFSCL